ncbi:hypothetical protein K501DRAFT_339114 [Backusella circina FSU 941]|nr:hypothetical protein K501DRAFT_339114 [Backusella circina FSU 941]
MTKLNDASTLENIHQASNDLASSMGLKIQFKSNQCQEQQQDDTSNNDDNDNDDDDSGDTYDDDNNNNDNTNTKCSFISGQGCLNGICKYCAMCIPSNCILGTPYSTGNNEGSTCEAIGEQDDGYDFYNYCLSPGDQYLNDDTSNGCPTSTVCYQYRHSTSAHAWDNLTCAQNSCLLLSRDGSPPPVPSSDNINITVSGPNTSHPRQQQQPHYYNPLDIKSGSAASIALTTSCIILALCIVALLLRCRKRLERKLALVLHHDVSSSPPPSFCSTPTPTMMMMMRASSSQETLPDYDENIPPKYEHAIVTQIRGFPSSASSSAEAAGWIPVYVSPVPIPRAPNDGMNHRQHGFQWVPSHQDWATIQHDQ